MMLLSSLLLFIAFSSVIGQGEEEPPLEFIRGFEEANHECLLEERVDGRIKSLKEAVERGCPASIKQFDCLDRKLKAKFGRSLVEIAQLLEEREDDLEKLHFRGYVNIKNVLKEVCTDGTQLNTDLMADLDCLNTVDIKEGTALKKVKECTSKIFTAYLIEGGRDLLPTDHLKISCVQEALFAACVSVKVHEECGRRAFNTINTLLKRSTYFSNIECLQRDDLESLKLNLPELLDLTESEREIFRQAIDLKRRK